MTGREYGEKWAGEVLRLIQAKPDKAKELLIRALEAALEDGRRSGYRDGMDARWNE